MNNVPRAIVLAAVFVCAACGLVYELALVTLGSYLLGNSVTQTSLVIAVTMFAMGLGALVAKPLTAWPLRSFVAVELALAVAGGLSVPALYAGFAWLHLYTPAMLGTTMLIGALVGAEIPLLMELLQRLRPQRASTAVADINAVDYVGALVGGLAFPFVLLPVFGLLTGTLLAAALNVAAAWLVAVALTRRSPRAGRQRLVSSTVCLAVLAGLGTMAWRSEEFELDARQAVYRDPIIHAERSRYQDIVVTRGSVRGRNFDDVRLYLDGDLQFSSLDEHRYHEALVHPALRGPRQRVLVLGGGDGLAVREILRYDDVESVTLVDLDPAVVDLARTFGPVRRLTAGALDDPRVHHVPADAFTWVRDAAGDAAYDVVVVDFPDPDSTATAKLYSVEMFGLIRNVLAPDGRIAVQAGSPYFAPRAFWAIRSTIAATGLTTLPYHADVPSFGDWGFVLAAAGEPDLRLADDAPRGLRFVTDAVLEAARVFPPDRDGADVTPSTLLDPTILDYATDEWVGY